MVLFSPIDPVDDENTSADAQGNIDRQKELEKTVNQDVASRVSSIYRDAPYIPASVILSLAKGGASKEAVRTAAQMSGNMIVQKESKKKKSWLQRNVYDKVKTASRWGTAGLNLVPDLIQNTASQVFSENDPAGWDGWFKSTQFGTMLANSDVAGEGYFLGGEAAQKQSERAREFRGTINGSAWTIGRGAAEVWFTPGSRAYSILSGFLDAAVAVGGDPTNYYGATIGKQFAQARKLPGLSGDALVAAQKLARGEAGLEAAESIAFNSSKFGQFIQRNNGAKRLISNIVDVSSKSDEAVEARTIKILEMFDYRIDPDTAARFAEAGTVDQVYGLLGEASGRLANAADDILLPSDIKEISGAGRFYSVKERTPLRNLRQGRWFSQMPKSSVVINGTGLERAESVKTYVNYMRGIGIKDAENTDVARLAVQAFRSSDPATAKQLLDEAFSKLVDTTLAEAGVKDAAVRGRFIDAARKKMASSRAYNVDELGKLDDGGFIKTILDPDNGFFTPEQLKDINPEWLEKGKLVSPGAIVELLDSVQFLPDFRTIRAFTSNPFTRRVLNSQKNLDKRRAFTLLETLQQDIWKPLQLATGGYIFRNMFDAQVRMAVAGKQGFFNHPWQYMMLAMNKRAGYSITDEAFNVKLFSDKFTAPEGLDLFVEALQFGTYKNIEDSRVAMERLFRNGNFSLVERAQDAAAHTTGYVDNLAQFHNDPIIRRIAKLGNMDPEEKTKRLLAYFNSAEGRADKSRVTSYLRNLTISDPDGKLGRLTIGLPDEVLSDDRIFELWVEKLADFKFGTIVRDDDDLRIVTAFNRVPLYTQTADGRNLPADRVRVPLDELRQFEFRDPDIIGSVVKGSAFGAEEGVEGAVINIVRENGQDFALIQPVFAGKAFSDDMLGTSSLRNLIDMKGSQGKLAGTVKRAERGLDPESKRRLTKSAEIWDEATDFFFRRVYGRASAIFEKSPVFRQYYYDNVAQNIDLLSKDEAQKLLANISQRASEAGVKEWEYVGTRARWKQIQDSAKAASGDGTIAQLDQFSQALALEDTKQLLYNATEKNNIEDIMRVIVPFGSAWREVLGTYIKFMVEDPTRIRKAQQIFVGATKFDPDANGEGFFYKDPTTGEYSFNFPLSSSITKLLTGVEAPMQAPVKRLSIGYSVIPSLGPVGQIAASRIIPDTPTFDNLTEIFLPYGRTTGIAFQPNWLKKAVDAWRANEGDAQSLYANTYVDTVRALAASGEYDLSNLDEQEKLYADAKGKARILTALRAVGQFVGPTSPQAEFRVPTEGGDVYATSLAKELYKLQAENYDTSVDRFIEIFGEDAFIYLSSKTRSVYGGLEASEQFGDWERNNQGLFAKYADVAGFMAPGGDDFSFEVWSRQLRQGKRERLTAREVVDQAQYRIAAAKYREQRAKLPANPNAQQKAWLKEWRIELNRQYPGFPVTPDFNPGEFPNKIVQLQNMVQEPSLQDNEVAQATAQYLAYRDKAIARYTQAGGSAGGFGQAVAAEPLRDWLWNTGQALALQVPEFGRIWERLLSNEVEQ